MGLVIMMTRWPCTCEWMTRWADRSPSLLLLLVFAAGTTLAVNGCSDDEESVRIDTKSVRIDTNGTAKEIVALLEKHQGANVLLTGVTGNVKRGAVVLLGEGVPIYLDGEPLEGLPWWPEELVGKRISVKGVLCRSEDWFEVKRPQWKLIVPDKEGEFRSMH